MKADATGANDGSSWADAFVELQSGLAAAEAGDEIWVAAGTYTPSARLDPNDPRSATFSLKNGVALYGGFEGTETERDQRDPAANVTILSGDLNGDDAVVTEALELWWDPNRNENSYHVVTGSGIDATAVLNGFRITAGNASGGPFFDFDDPRRRGGGVFINLGGPTLINCTLTRNDARCGGGLYTSGGSPTLADCTFRENLAAGIYNTDGNLTLTHCTFTRNWNSDAGGGLRNVHSTSTLTNCTFTENFSDHWGGGIANRNSTATLINCTFNGNSADSIGGGGMYTENGALTLTNCMFNGNSASGSGGGMYNFGFTATLTNCMFSGNSASGFGGGMFNLGGDATLTNCVFSGNSARDAGGIYTAYTTTLVNCTFAGNSADDGAGGGRFTFRLSGRPRRSDSRLPQTLTNCIFWGNAVGGRVEESTQIVGDLSTVGFSCIQGLSSFTGNGNIGDDPLFVGAPSDGGDGWGDDPATLDVDEGANDDFGNLRLQPGSPGINAGDPALIVAEGETDLDRRTRVQGGRIDMGPYETPWAQGDSDFDGDVDLANYISFLACFTAPGLPPGAACSSFDFDGDNDLDLADLVSFQSAMTDAR